MAVVASVNGVTRRIYLSISTMNASVHPIDIYKEVRALRRTDESLRKFDNFLEASGNVAKGGGKFTPRLVTCLSGTRIVPYDSTHELTITGEVITDDEQSGVDCFDKSLLSVGVGVDINYIPPQVEIIVISGDSGGGATPADIWSHEPRTLTLYISGAALGDIENSVLSGNLQVLAKATDVTDAKDDIADAIDTRLAASDYTAPDNTTIASIWTRVQQLLKLGDFLGLK